MLFSFFFVGQKKKVQYDLFWLQKKISSTLYNLFCFFLQMCYFQDAISGIEKIKSIDISIFLYIYK